MLKVPSDQMLLEATFVVVGGGGGRGEYFTNLSQRQRLERNSSTKLTRKPFN